VINLTIGELGSLGEFVAAIATIFTLVYLAIQIRHNTRAAREEATRHLVLANSEATMAMVLDQKLSEIVEKGFLGEEIPLDEQFRFNGFLFSYYNLVDYAYGRFREGSLNEKYWSKISNEIPAFIGSPGGRKWWTHDKVRFSEEFVNFVDITLAEAESPLVIPTIPAARQKSR